MYDSDYREADVTALDTATDLTEQGADSPGSFDVPVGARLITEVIIGIGVDATADTLLGFSSGIQLTGGGVDIGEGYFPGPVGSICGAAATSAGLTYAQPQRYKTKIPVVGGGPIKATAYLHGEDIGAVHALVGLVYDGTPGKIIDMDYREADITAANTLVNLNTRAGSTERDFDVSYNKLCEIHFGAGLKAVAGPLRMVPALHLSGPAFQTGGNYKFIGPSGGSQDDIAVSGAMTIQQLTQYECDISMNKGNKLRAQAQMVEDDAGTAYAVVGLGFMA